MSSLTEDSSTSSSLEGFIAEGSVFAQPKKGPCSQVATWSTLAFSPGFPAAFLREWHTGNLPPRAMQGSCAEYLFPPLSVRSWVSRSLMGEQGLCNRWSWQRVLGLYALWGGRAPGTHRIVKCGAWGLLACGSGFLDA